MEFPKCGSTEITKNGRRKGSKTISATAVVANSLIPYDHQTFCYFKSIAMLKASIHLLVYDLKHWTFLYPC